MIPRYIDKDALLNKMEEQYEDLEKFYGKYHDCVMGFSDAMQLLEKEFFADIGLENRFLDMQIANARFAGRFVMFTQAQVSPHRDIAIDVAQKCWRTNNGKIH